ncbi:MAG: tRNA 2-thiocytidine(32) synthetase TtcA [Deltaproteobacteria bacterium]|nr:MAG: tRNA 2-thiocytidine(32) synthetase TtcA [Deltaproteobacteria bacterium]
MDELGRIEKRILKKTGQAIHDFSMISEGDRVLVGLSGGKDSWTLLHILETLRRRAPVKFELAAITIDPGFEEFDASPLAAYCRDAGFTFYHETPPLAKIIEENKIPGTTYCSFCSRLRRGCLYTFAIEHRYNKIALGHHADDLIETLLMAQFFTGVIKSMPPVLSADDGVNTVIRPLCRVFEADISEFAELSSFPVIECGCPPHRAGGDDQKRQQIKRLLNELEAGHEGIKANLLASLGRVLPRYLMGEAAG